MALIHLQNTGGLLAVVLIAGLTGSGCREEPGQPKATGSEGAPVMDVAGFSMTDVTREAGIRWTHTFGDTHLSSILEDTGSGAAWIDYDGDGWLDLYLVNGTHVEGSTAVLPDREKPLPGTAVLYRNRGDGTFEDVTAKAGLDREVYGTGGAVADFDGDGDEDLFLCNYGPNVLYRNRGDGTFEDATAETGLAGPGKLNGFWKWSTNAVWFDADGDGDLDLYVANYIAFDPSYRSYYLPEGMPGPDSYLGQNPLFYLNDGGKFVETAGQSGLLVKGAKGMGSAAADFDGDGDLDLYQANDTTANFLFQNDGKGHFDNVAVRAGTAYTQSGEASASMHPSWGDVDHDGRLDLYIPDLTFGGLFLNQGDGRFEDRTIASGLAAVSGKFSGWGAALHDFDLDGHLDLFVANGKFHHLFPEQDLLFAGDGNGNFRDVTDSAGEYFRVKHVGRGAAFADYDNDGDVDAVVVNNEPGAAPVLLRNDVKGKRSWLSVRVLTKDGTPDAIGARVELYAGGLMQVGVVQRAQSFLSSSDPRVHFGLGDAVKVDRLHVRWPGGAEVTLKDVEVDRMVTVREGRGGAS